MVDFGGIGTTRYSRPEPCEPRLIIFAAAFEGLRKTVPQQALWQQPRLLDDGQGELLSRAVVRELDDALADRRLAGGGAVWTLRRIENDTVLRTPVCLHPGHDL